MSDRRQIAVDMLQHLAADDAVVGGTVGSRLGRVADKQPGAGVAGSGFLDTYRTEIEPLIVHAVGNQHFRQNPTAAADLEYRTHPLLAQQFANFAVQRAIGASQRSRRISVLQVETVVILWTELRFSHFHSRRSWYSC